MKEVYLVRHGATVQNQKRILQGSGSDPVLSPLGIVQARILAEKLSHLRSSMIVSSPMRRASETAGYICKRQGSEVVLDTNLRERDFGPFEGLGRQELINQRHSAGLLGDDVTGDFSTAEGVEPFDKFQSRVSGAYLEAVAGVSNGPVILVAHGGVIRALYHWFRALPESYAHALNTRNASYLLGRTDGERTRFEVRELWINPKEAGP